MPDFPGHSEPLDVLWNILLFRNKIVFHMKTPRLVSPYWLGQEMNNLNKLTQNCLCSSDQHVSSLHLSVSCKCSGEIAIFLFWESSASRSLGVLAISSVVLQVEARRVLLGNNVGVISESCSTMGSLGSPRKKRLFGKSTKQCSITWIITVVITV